MIPAVKEGLKPVPGFAEKDRKKELICFDITKERPLHIFSIHFMDFFQNVNILEQLNRDFIGFFNGFQYSHLLKEY